MGSLGHVQRNGHGLSPEALQGLEPQLGGSRQPEERTIGGTGDLRSQEGRVVNEIKTYVKKNPKNKPTKISDLVHAQQEVLGDHKKGQVRV